MKFDWYQATVPADAEFLIYSLRQGLKPAKVTTGKGSFNYHHKTVLLSAADEQLALILHGGQNGDPNVQFSGQTTPESVELFRGYFPSHRVTRFDAAEDFVEEGAFPALYELCRGVADSNRVKGLSFVPDDPLDGHTYSMGAKSSSVHARLYEKTAEQRKKLPESRWGEVPDNWTRLECIAKPKDKQVREWCAKMQPEDVWGFSTWTKELASRALAIDVQRIHTRIQRESDDDKAIRVMCQQYGKILMRMKDELGDWGCVGLTLGEVVAKLKG